MDDDGAPQFKEPDCTVTVLMKASKNGHLEVVQALVAAGADINATNDVGGEGYIYGC